MMWRNVGDVNATEPEGVAPGQGYDTCNTKSQPLECFEVLKSRSTTTSDARSVRSPSFRFLLCPGPHADAASRRVLPLPHG